MSQEKIITSPEPPVVVSKGNFLNTVFKDVNKWLEKPAIECSETGVIYTYSQLLDQIKQWSGFLKKFDLKPQDPVIVISPNCLPMVPIFFGTVALGKPISFPKPTYSSNEIRKLIFKIGGKFIVYSREVEDTVIGALKEDIINFQLFCIGKPKKLKAMDVESIFCGKEFVSSSWITEITGEETALIAFSSGSTGTPKAVEISHNSASNFMYSRTNDIYQNLGWKQEIEEPTFMVTLPFHHFSSPLVWLSLGLFMGTKIVIFPKSSLDTFFEGIIKHKVTSGFFLPSQLNLLITNPKYTEETIPSLKSVECGGAPLLKSKVDAFRKKFKGIDIVEVYGMTETIISHVMPKKYKNLYGCGQLLSSNEAKIICKETGETLGPNQKGEICIKSPTVMKGYLNDQKATDEILKNGWIHTGDIGYYDENQFFFVVDRIKDIIKVDGLQVSPSEIENELQKHPSVLECSVVGKPNTVLGELPFAFVIPKEKVSKEELQNFLKDKLADYKQLRGGIKFVESFPRSATGKVLKRELKSII